MQNNYNFFEYYSVSSFVHRLSSIYKILSLIILFIILMNTSSIIDFIVINLFILVMMLWSNISFRLYFSSLTVFRFLLLLIFVFVSLFSLNIINGIVWTIRIFDFLMYIIIINITTSLNDMVNGFYRLLRPFKRFFDINSLALDAALDFKFFGLCYTEYNRIKLSKKLRGVRFSDMNFFDKIEYFLGCIKPVLKKSIEKLDVLKNNMFIKNYGISNHISNYRLNKWGKIDTMLIVINIFMMIISFVY